MDFWCRWVVSNFFTLSTVFKYSLFSLPAFSHEHCLFSFFFHYCSCFSMLVLVSNSGFPFIDNEVCRTASTHSERVLCSVWWTACLPECIYAQGWSILIWLMWLLGILYVFVFPIDLFSISTMLYPTASSVYKRALRLLFLHSGSDVWGCWRSGYRSWGKSKNIIHIMCARLW